jgi:ABC-type transport system involved in multi-copper enzyme maturation permease subunit
MNVLTRELVAKELRQHAWLIGISTLAGLGSLVLATQGPMPFNIGMLVWISTIIALGVIVVLMGISNERKERSLLYALSLPLSGADYVRIKLLALFSCFFFAWLTVSVGALALVWFDPDVANGLLPYTILLCVYLLTNFAVVLCAGLHFKTEAPMTAVIVVTNMGVTVYMFTVGAAPGLRGTMYGAVPVWNQPFWLTLGIELAVLAAALALPVFIAARRRDHL